MTKSRFDRLADRFSDAGAERMVNQADRRYWALYRTLDLSQPELIDQVKSYVETSQPTVSRVVSKGDTRALVDEEFIHLGGQLGREAVTDGFYPDEWLEAYRDLLATAVVDRMALEIIAHEQRLTPEWAARRYPELVGCNEHVARSWGIDEDQINRDTHLNHLESVNTERWK
jgi:hypothetical protein